MPQLDVVHVGRHNLSVSTLVILSLDEVHKGIVDACTVRKEKARTGRELVEEEKLLLLSDLAMVTLRSLFEDLLVLSHLLGVRERDTVDSLERIILGVSQEIRGGVLHDSKSLDSASVGDMRSTAQINQRTATVNSG